MKKFILKYKNILFLILITAIIFYFLYNLYGKYFKIYYNPESIKQWTLSYGKLSFMVFILLQVAQVVIFFIPGEVIQTAGGYIFGTFNGIILSIIGILLGSMFTFLVSKIFGNKLLRKILPVKEYGRVKKLIDKPKNTLLIFILYLIPGFPKDILGYAAGITPIRLGSFLFFSSIARVPGIIMSSYIGSNLYNENYFVVLIVLLFAVILLVIGTINNDKIINNLEKLMYKKVK